MTSDIYLGLDISTSYTGWALIKSDGTVVDVGWIDITKIESMDAKADFVEKTFLKMEKPAKIFVEDNVLKFRNGSSTAHVIITLAKFNAIVCYICWKLWGISPVAIPSITARRLVGLKVPKGENAKDHVYNWAQNNSDKKFWSKREIKTGKRKGTLVPVNGTIDAADALLLVTAGLKTLPKTL